MSDEIIKGGKELDAFLKALPAKVEQNILRSALRAGANEFRAEVKQNLQANDSVDSGELLKSVRVSVRARRGVVTASVKAGNKAAWYWRLVEFGTKPHKIEAKNGKALNIGGSFPRSVMHPGAKPKPFARPAFDSKASAAIVAVGNQIRKRLTKEGINAPAPEVE